MSAPKPNTKYGFMAKVEATYGTAITLAGASDGVLLSERPDPANDYLHGGEHSRAPGSGGKLPSTPPSGLGFSCKASMHARGGGVAYSASVVPPGLHTLMRACGFEATGSFTGGSESWTYAPESGPTGFDSVTVEAYVNGQKHPATGVYGTFSVGVDGPGVPVWEFDLQGIGVIPTDAAVPAITYPLNTNLPPKAVNIAFSVGTGTPFTAAKVRSFNFTLNRDLSARADDNSAGHAGFTPGDRDPILEVVIEAVTLHTSSPWYTATAFNPYKMRDDKNLVAVSLQVGTVQYKRWKITLPQAELFEVEDGEDGNTALWTLRFRANVSTPILDDDVSIQFN